MFIAPTIGRVVWYRPASAEDFGNSGQPLAAIVAHVWNDRMVNLCVIDPNGVPMKRTSVTLKQGDDLDNISEGNAFCEWMPYQIGQAAKHAADKGTPAHKI